MSGKILHVVPRPHFCRPPFWIRRNWWVGTTWECHCGKQWVVTYDYTCSRYWAVLDDAE